VPESLVAGGDMIRAAAPITGADGTITGVVVAGDYLTGELASPGAAHDQGLRVLLADARAQAARLTGVYLSFYLMVTLMIMVAATWIGLYLAKRVTRPIRLLEAAATRSAPGTSITGSSRRRSTSSGRWPSVQLDGHEVSTASANSSARPSTSAGRTERSRRGGASSRRSSNASPPA